MMVSAGQMVPLAETIGNSKSAETLWRDRKQCEHTQTHSSIQKKNRSEYRATRTRASDRDKERNERNVLHFLDHSFPIQRTTIILYDIYFT